MNTKDMKQLFGTLSPDEKQLDRIKANISKRVAPRRSARLRPITVIAAMLILIMGITAVSASPALKQWFFPGIGVIEVEDDTEPLYMMLDKTSGDNDRYTTTYGFWLEGTVQFWIESTVRYDEMDVGELMPYSNAQMTLLGVSKPTAFSAMTGFYSIKIPDIKSEQAAEGILLDGNIVKFSGMPSRYRQYTTEQCGMRLTMIPLTEDLTTFAVELEYADGRGSVTPTNKFEFTTADVESAPSFSVVDKNGKVYALQQIYNTNIFTTGSTPSAEIVRFKSDCVTFSSIFVETPVIVTIEVPKAGEAATLACGFTFPDGVTEGMITAVGYNNPIEKHYNMALEKYFPQGYLSIITSNYEQNGIKYWYDINYSADYKDFIEPHLVPESQSPYDQTFEPMASRTLIRVIDEGLHLSLHYIDDGSGAFDVAITDYSAQAFGDWRITFGE